MSECLVLFSTKRDKKNQPRPLKPVYVHPSASTHISNTTMETYRSFPVESLFCRDDSNIHSYVFERCLGHGRFGVVALATRQKDGRRLAVKVQHKSLAEEGSLPHGKTKALLRESRILSQLNHPFLVRTQACFQTTNLAFIAMELVKGATLATVYHELTPDNVKFFLRETCLAICHLHGLGIVHMDLKPDNVMITDAGHAKIIDFGNAIDNVHEDDMAVPKFQWRNSYMAPELLDNGRKCYLVTLDWYAIGAIAYFLLTKERPEEDLQDSEFYLESLGDPVASAFVLSLLETDPEVRLYGNSVLKHEYFKNTNWHDVYECRIESPWNGSASHPVKNAVEDEQLLRRLNMFMDKEKDCQDDPGLKGFDFGI